MEWDGYKEGCWCGLSSWIIGSSTCHKVCECVYMEVKERNPARQTISDRRGSPFVLQRRRKTSLKWREHLKGERGEGEKGEKVQGVEGGGMSSLWSFNEMHMLWFIWSQFLQRHASDTSVPNPSTGNTTVSITDSPKTLKAFTSYRGVIQMTLQSVDSKQTTVITAVMSQSNMKPINTQTSACHKMNQPDDGPHVDHI